MTDEEQKRTDLLTKQQADFAKQTDDLDNTRTTTAGPLKTVSHFEKLDKERQEAVGKAQEAKPHPHPSTNPGPTVGADVEESDKWTVGARVSTPDGGTEKLTDAPTEKSEKARLASEAANRKAAEDKARATPGAPAPAAPPAPVKK